MQPIQPAVPGQPLRASDLNAQTAEVRRQGNVNFDGGIVSQEIGGLHISIPAQESFFARITKRISASPYRYGYIEVTRRKSDWVATTNGRTSDGVTDYAVEFNGNGLVPLNAVVELQPIFNFVENNRMNHVYGFKYHYMMPVAQENYIEVVTGVTCTPEGINCTTVTLSGASYDNSSLRQFISLTDVDPKSYIGNANRAVCVNSTGTGLTFGAVINHMTTSFISLSDTPSSYGGSTNAYASVSLNSSGSGIAFSKNLVTTQHSVTGGGNPNSPSYSAIKLAGDVSSPGANKYYGTDGSGTKGFFSLTSDALTQLQAQVNTLQNTVSVLASKVSALGG